MTSDAHSCAANARFDVPDVKRCLLEAATIPAGDSSAHFASYIKDEIAKWKRVIELGKIDKI